MAPSADHAVLPVNDAVLSMTDPMQSAAGPIGWVMCTIGCATDPIG